MTVAVAIKCRAGGDDLVDTWTEDELRCIAAVEEVQIAPVRRSGELRRSSTIWAVRVGDDVYVRAAYGSASTWYGVARGSGRARIRAGGIERDVAVEEPDTAVLDAVDAAYRAKYGGRHARIVEDLVQPGHRIDTVRLVPIAD